VEKRKISPLPGLRAWPSSPLRITILSYPDSHTSDIRGINLFLGDYKYSIATMVNITFFLCASSWNKNQVASITAFVAKESLVKFLSSYSLKIELKVGDVCFMICASRACGFESQFSGSQSLRFFMVFLSPPNTCCDITTKLIMTISTCSPFHHSQYSHVMLS
jgi:hypothetical protein